MKQKIKQKPWGKMTAAELAEATKEFDHPLPASRYKPSTSAERERFEKARRAGSSPEAYLRALDLDSGLRQKATAYAKRKNLTVFQLLERGLRRELAVED